MGLELGVVLLCLPYPGTGTAAVYQHTQLEAPGCYSVRFACRIYEWKDAYRMLSGTERPLQRIARRWVYRVFWWNRSIMSVCFAASPPGAPLFPRGHLALSGALSIVTTGVGSHRHLSWVEAARHPTCVGQPNNKELPSVPQGRQHQAVRSPGVFIQYKPICSLQIRWEPRLPEWTAHSYSPLLGWHRGLRKPRAIKPAGISVGLCVFVCSGFFHAKIHLSKVVSSFTINSWISS